MSGNIVCDVIRRKIKCMRIKRMQRFLDIMKPSSQEAILDIGGLHDLWADFGYKGSIVFCNLDKPDTYRAIHPFPKNCNYIQGDGRSLNFPNNSFEIVFSNSVIKHVGNWSDQKAFAHEISRVGKRYWVQTPNMNFPVEPHFNFPFFQWFSYPVRKQIAAIWPFSWFKRCGQFNDNNIEEIVRSIRLLTIEEMRSLYPDVCYGRSNYLAL